MEIIERKAVPIYEAICPECKSVLQYKKSELHLGGYLTCPVCGDTVWGSAIKPVKYMDNSEEMVNDDVLTIHIEKHGHWVHGKELSRDYIGDVCVSIHYDKWWCSECNYPVEEQPLWKFCPNCSAKMDGAE